MNGEVLKHSTCIIGRSTPRCGRRTHPVAPPPRTRTARRRRLTLSTARVDLAGSVRTRRTSCIPHRVRGVGKRIERIAEAPGRFASGASSACRRIADRRGPARIVARRPRLRGSASGGVALMRRGGSGCQRFQRQVSSRQRVRARHRLRSVPGTQAVACSGPVVPTYQPGRGRKAPSGARESGLRATRAARAMAAIVPARSGPGGRRSADTGRQVPGGATRGSWIGPV